MRPSPFRRSHIGITSLVVFALIGAILASSPTAPAVEAQQIAEPQFFTWAGDPFGDDLNHYIITVSSTDSPHDTWLQVTADDLLVAAESPPSRVEPALIDEVVGEDLAHLDPTEVVASLALRSDIASIRPLSFDMYAVAGSIESTELAAAPGVASVAVDSALQTATVDPYYPTQWGLDNDGNSTDPWVVAADADIDAPEGWHRTRGNGVIVAVVDSGVDITHPDLVANIWRNPGEICGNAQDDDSNGYIDDCSGWDFAAGSPSVTDYVGHGTHVAGIIAAEANNGIGVAGVAYEAQVMPLKIGDTPSLSAAIEAIAYAIDNGASVINASWVVDDADAAPLLDIAIAAAADAGVLFVAAAGNEPRDIDSSPVYPASSPLANVVTVAASTPTDQPAEWTSFGDENVDLFAPGEYIISTVPGGYGIYSGTSMAAPMVSAAAALLWSATPEATYSEVKGALLDRSDGPNDGVTAFRGMAASDGRLNIDRSIYSAPLFQPSLMYNFYEFNSFEPNVAHKVAITAKTVDPWIVPPQTPAMYRAGLYVPVDGQPMAVVGHEITYTGAEGDLTVTTDETGRALVGTEFQRQSRSAFVKDGDFTPLAMELPAGTYAFVMEIVDVSDPADLRTMGDPSAVFFIVDDDGSITEMPQIPIGGGSTPETTTTSEAAVTTTTLTTTSGAPTTTSIAPGSSTTLPSETTTTTVTAPGSTTTTAPAQVTTTTSGSATTTTAAPGAATTTTTAAPATTIAPPPTTSVSAPTTTTTTTAGPGGSGGTTPTTTVATDGFTITSVNPAEGPVAGHTLVTITGKNMPDLPQVFFGDRSAEIVSVLAPTFIVVDTPPGNPGWVDVTITDRSTGDSTVLSNGFVYLDDGEEPPETTTTLTPVSTTLGVTTTTSAATTTTMSTPTTEQPPTVTTHATNPTDEFGDWRDSLLRTPEGLTLAPPASDARIANIPVDLWVGNLCDSSVCPGWVLES